MLQQTEPVQPTTTYVHIMRAASGMFEPEQLERWRRVLRGGPRLSEVNGQGIAAIEPIAATEAIAYDFLAKGGKYSRPFITLAVHDALDRWARHPARRCGTRRRALRFDLPDGHVDRDISQSVPGPRRHRR